MYKKDKDNSNFVKLFSAACLIKYTVWLLNKAQNLIQTANLLQIKPFIHILFQFMLFFDTILCFLKEYWNKHIHLQHYVTEF